MLTGLGKGLVGTVTKPVVGVLDFASGAATAIRDTSGDYQLSYKWIHCCEACCDMS